MNLKPRHSSLSVSIGIGSVDFVSCSWLTHQQQRGHRKRDDPRIVRSNFVGQRDQHPERRVLVSLLDERSQAALVVVVDSTPVFHLDRDLHR